MADPGGIPRFVPGVPHRVGYRALAGVLRFPWARDVGMACARRFDPFFKMMINGPLGPHLPMPFITVTGAGARTGLPRTAALVYFSDGEDLIVVASNFGGPKNPAWYYNLQAHPLVSVRCGRIVAAFCASEILDAAEHERLYRMAEAVYPGYEAYRHKTAAVGRRIPIMRLRPAG